MTIVDAIILGFVQGITEFLPISSSGHLILVRDFLGLDLVGTLTFDAMLQLATTLAVIVYFFQDLWKLATSLYVYVFKKVRTNVVTTDMRVILLLIIATIPAVILGLLLEDLMDSVFRNERLVIWTLLAGAIVLLLAEKIASKARDIQKKSEYDTNANGPVRDQISFKKAVLVGLFQSLALIPGMSRSGMTISGGLFLGISRDQAVRFAFLMAVPVLLGSGAKKILDLLEESAMHMPTVTVGFSTSFVVGLLAIHFLITYLKKHTLKIFAWYRIALVVVLLFIL